MTAAPVTPTAPPEIENLLHDLCLEVRNHAAAEINTKESVSSLAAVGQYHRALLSAFAAQQARIEVLKTERDAMVGALRPLAAVAEKLPLASDSSYVSVRVGDLRHARSLIQEDGK